VERGRIWPFGVQVSVETGKSVKLLKRADDVTSSGVSDRGDIALRLSRFDSGSQVSRECVFRLSSVRVLLIAVKLFPISSIIS
jgi:hypothetical protein